MPRSVTYSVTVRKMSCDRIGHQFGNADSGSMAGVVTHIYQNRKRRLFLREHRKAKGVSATVMAGRLGIERESVLRLEREPQRVNSEKQADYATALDLQPEDLWRPPAEPEPPKQPSLDEIVKDAPDETRAMAFDIVRRLIGGGR